MQTTLAKLWFWLTTHIDCAWCQKRLHRAWLPLTYRMGNKTVPRISSGICPKCLEGLH